MEAAMKRPNISMRAIRHAASQGGFSLIEVMISIAILTIGSVGLLGVFGLAVKATQTTQEDMVSRQLAAETMESIYTARNSAEIGWPAIANVSNGGIFVDGLQSVKCAGPDGILDTADDSSCLTASGATCPNGGIECLTEPVRMEFWARPTTWFCRWPTISGRCRFFPCIRPALTPR
jgi:prepilin-type N-terminal cleavage/methylation domain-containing protein